MSEDLSATTLLLIGAGPKSLAVAAKATVLRELGLPAPRVTIVEPHTTGSNWTMVGGRTNGTLRLGTSPEKDLGFPYTSSCYGDLDREVDMRMQRFSWVTYMVETGRYADWVDRSRPSPRHAQWAEYLVWAASRAEFDRVRGWVRTFDIENGQWCVSIDPGTSAPVDRMFDHVMVTGPGPLLQRFREGGICSLEEFWRFGLDLADVADPTVAVIGGGETAAAIVEQLTELRCRDITCVTPKPILYSRGEGYFENAIYSSPEKWTTLTDAERRELVARTDRGVFSVRSLRCAVEDGRLRHLQGRVVSCSSLDGKVQLGLRNEERADESASFDIVIDGTGSGPHWFVDLLGDRVKERFVELAGEDRVEAFLERSMANDLSIGPLEPKLFVPSLAGHAQGPGFANLSCLGLLADRVLEGVSGSKVLAESIPTSSEQLSTHNSARRDGNEF